MSKTRFSPSVSASAKMTEITSSYFFKHCQKILSRMTDEEILNAKNLTTNKDRIKTLYKFAVAVDVPYDFQQKDFSAAERLKAVGNDFYKKRDNHKAIECYNQGIVICPQTNDKDKQLLTLLIANRSACFFDLKRYKKVIYDIDYLLDVGFYPKELLHKIYARQAKCYEEIGDKSKAEISYNNLITSLENAKLSEKEKAEKIKQTQAINKKTSEKQTAIKKPHHKMPKVDLDAIKIESEEELGRYAVAKSDVEIGTIIMSDEPFVACVAPNFLLKNCQHCMKSTKVFIACENCSSAIFCSRKCKKDALEQYHKHECNILQFLAASGVSLNCLLSLRMITKNCFDKINVDFDKSKFVLKNKFDTDNYEAVMSLCQHNEKRQQGQFVHYTCMAIFLLRLLKQSQYFPGDKKCNDELLNENELIVGTKLLEHLLLLEYNAHEVAELTITVDDKGKLDKQTETIGGALYVNLAFFNHSCEPSIIRYNDGRKMVVKTIKPIKKGEPFYENYGPIYTRDAKQQRQAFLQGRYCFECKCKPCTENWPLLEEMNPSTFKIYCKNELCKAEVTLHKDSTNMKCPKCDTPDSFMNTLMKLMEMTKITKEGEDYYQAKNYDDAFQSFCKALQNCYSNLIPPHPDIVQLQQRLRECIVNFGNQRDEPPSDLNAPIY